MNYLSDLSRIVAYVDSAVRQCFWDYDIPTYLLRYRWSSVGVQIFLRGFVTNI